MPLSEVAQIRGVKDMKERQREGGGREGRREGGREGERQRVERTAIERSRQIIIIIELVLQGHHLRIPLRRLSETTPDMRACTFTHGRWLPAGLYTSSSSPPLCCIPISQSAERTHVTMLRSPPEPSDRPRPPRAAQAPPGRKDT